MSIADWLRRLLRGAVESDRPDGDETEEETGPAGDDQPDGEDDPTTYPLW